MVPKPSSAMPQMRVITIIAPNEVDIANSRELRDALAEASVDADVIVVDMTATTVCDASAIDTLAWFHQRVHDSGGELRVACSAWVRRVMAVTGQDEVLQLYPSMRTALMVDRWHMRVSHMAAALDGR